MKCDITCHLSGHNFKLGNSTPGSMPRHIYMNGVATNSQSPGFASKRPRLCRLQPDVPLGFGEGVGCRPSMHWLKSSLLALAVRSTFSPRHCGRKLLNSRSGCRSRPFPVPLTHSQVQPHTVNIVNTLHQTVCSHVTHRLSVCCSKPKVFIYQVCCITPIPDLLVCCAGKFAVGCVHLCLVELC